MCDVGFNFVGKAVLKRYRTALCKRSDYFITTLSSRSATCQMIHAAETASNWCYIQDCTFPVVCCIKQLGINTMHYQILLRDASTSVWTHEAWTQGVTAEATIATFRRPPWYKHVIFGPFVHEAILHHALYRHHLQWSCYNPDSHLKKERSCPDYSQKDLLRSSTSTMGISKVHHFGTGDGCEQNRL